MRLRPYSTNPVFILQSYSARWCCPKKNSHALGQPRDAYHRWDCLNAAVSFKHFYHTRLFATINLSVIYHGETQGHTRLTETIGYRYKTATRCNEVHTGGQNYETKCHLYNVVYKPEGAFSNLQARNYYVCCIYIQSENERNKSRNPIAILFINIIYCYIEK